MRRWQAVLSAVASLSGLSSACAQDSSLPFGRGGPINAPALIQQINAHGRPFRIEGECRSSCTMLLAVRKACVDPSATLLFHAALFPNERGQKPPPARQARMLASYKPALRSYLVKGGYVETFEFHAISGRDLIARFGYTACSSR